MQLPSIHLERTCSAALMVHRVSHHRSCNKHGTDRRRLFGLQVVRHQPTLDARLEKGERTDVFVVNKKRIMYFVVVLLYASVVP